MGTPWPHHLHFDGRPPFVTADADFNFRLPACGREVSADAMPLRLSMFEQILHLQNLVAQSLSFRHALAARFDHYSLVGFVLGSLHCG